MKDTLDDLTRRGFCDEETAETLLAQVDPIYGILLEGIVTSEHPQTGYITAMESKGYKLLFKKVTSHSNFYIIYMVF